MFTLHDTIELIKKIGIFAVIGAVIIFILFLLFQFGVFIKNTFFPDAPPPAQVAFGKLPPIEFGESEPGEFTYTIDTLSGNLPIMQERVNVYEIVQPVPEFFDFSRATTKAKNINLTGNPTEVSEGIYQWSANTDFKPIFIINTVTNDFAYQTAYLTYNPIADSPRGPTVETAKNASAAFLQSLNSFPITIDEASTSATMYSIKDGTLIPANSASTTQIVRLDYIQYPIESLPLYNQDYPSSLIYTYVANGGSKDIVVEASYITKEVSETFSDYPIKSSEEAYAELEEGNAYIATNSSSKTEINITDVSLGYFVSSGEQQYLMPVFVFKGNDDTFFAFVSAVQNDFIE